MNVNTTQSMQQPEEPKDESIMVNKSSLGDMANSLKVGDSVEMKVSAIQGDMVELMPSMDDDADDQDPNTMPLDKLEASLPKAEER